MEEEEVAVAAMVIWKGHVRAMVHLCEGQRTTFGGQFSPSRGF